MPAIGSLITPFEPVTRPLIRGIVGGIASLTPLAQILALSPSLLIWPANGGGWQGTSGGTLSAIGQPVGLLTDLSQLGGKTQTEWLAAPTTADQIPNGVVGIAGTATAATYNTTTGDGTFDRIDASNQSFVFWSSLSAQPYYLSVDAAAGGVGLQIRAGTRSGTIVGSVSAGTSGVFVVQPGANQITFTGSAVGTTTFRVHAFRELPGNIPRAGTWPLPADSSRALLTAGGALNFDGVNDYYSLLNAISITTNMTVVRAFKRSAAGIVNAGLGQAASANQYVDIWSATNNIINRLPGANTLSGQTQTGSFVHAVRRNASTVTLRQNGSQIMSNDSITASGTLDAFGRVDTLYNSGEISFLFLARNEAAEYINNNPAALALLEQIAASTNGAPLA